MLSRSPLTRAFRGLAASALLVLSAVLLAGCGSQVTIAGHSFGSQPPPQAAPPSAAAPPAAINTAPLETPGAAQPGAPPGAVPIGLLLPLSGPSAALGQALLDAAQMALYDSPDSHLQLVIRDTKGDPQTAAAAAQSAIAAGARLLIGPLLAGEVTAVKPVAQAANITVLAFSNSAQVAGDGTFLLGFPPQEEIARVIAYAQSRGLSRIGVLAPQSPYGDVALAAAQQAVGSNGGSLARIGRYAPDAAPGELRDAVHSFAEGGIGFDAMLLPEGGTRLREIAPLLPYDGIDPDKVKLLGTGLWDVPDLGTEPALNGGWYAAPDPAPRAAFTQRFTALYHHAPPLLATLGYDATALAGALARNPSGPDFSPTAIANPSGFAGVDGIFRFLPTGIVQRGLAVLEVQRGAPTVLDPAPTTFQSIGE